MVEGIKVSGSTIQAFARICRNSIPGTWGHRFQQGFPNLSGAYIMLKFEALQVWRQLLLHIKLAHILALAQEWRLPVRGPRSDRLELGLRPRWV